MGISKNKKKILVVANIDSFINLWWHNYLVSRLCCCAIYLYNILVIKILGISAFYHDSAATLLIDGKIIAAAQEERFTRVKHDSSYPFNAIEFVLKFANLSLSNIDHIVFYEKPFLKFERLLKLSSFCSKRLSIFFKSYATLA